MKNVILGLALLLSSSAFASFQKLGPCANEAAAKSLEAVLVDGIQAKIISSLQGADSSQYSVMVRASAQMGGSMLSLVSVKVDPSSCKAVDITNVQWSEQ